MKSAAGSTRRACANVAGCTPGTGTDAFQAEWEALAARVRAVPFLRPGWVTAWWRAFGAGDLSVGCLRKDGRLVAVLPVASGRDGLRTATNYHTPQSGILAESRDDARALVQTLLQDRPSRLAVEGITAAGPDMAACREAAENCRYRILVRPFQKACYLELSGSRDEYTARLSRNLRTDLRRCRRRLDAAGTVTASVHDGADGLDDLLDRSFAVEASGWKGERGTAIRSSPQTLGFYTDIARWAAVRDMLRLCFLRLDDRPLATYFALESHGTWHLLKGGYDNDFRRCSPGKLLMHDVIRHCYASGVDRIEFHGDAEAYKLRWTHSFRELKRIDAFPRSASGSARWAATAVRPLVRSVLVRMGAL